MVDSVREIRAAFDALPTFAVVMRVTARLPSSNQLRDLLDEGDHLLCPGNDVHTTCDGVPVSPKDLPLEFVGYLQTNGEPLQPAMAGVPLLSKDDLRNNFFSRKKAREAGLPGWRAASDSTKEFVSAHAAFEKEVGGDDARARYDFTIEHRADQPPDLAWVPVHGSVRMPACASAAQAAEALEQWYEALPDSQKLTAAEYRRRYPGDRA